MARSINLLHIAKALNDGRAIEIDATAPSRRAVAKPDRGGWRVNDLPTAISIIGWGCLGIASVCFAALVIA